MWKTVPDLSGSVNVEELQELFKSVDKKHDKNQTSEDKASKASLSPSMKSLWSSKHKLNFPASYLIFACSKS